MSSTFDTSVISLNDEGDTVSNDDDGEIVSSDEGGSRKRGRRAPRRATNADAIEARAVWRRSELAPHNLVWTAELDAKYAGDRIEPAQINPFYRTQLKKAFDSINPRLAANTEFFQRVLRDRTLPKPIYLSLKDVQSGKRRTTYDAAAKEDVPRLFRKMYEYANDLALDKLKTTDAVTDDARHLYDYTQYCSMMRNRPENNAVWEELKKLIRTWDQVYHGNKDRTASINKYNFCDIIW